MGNGPTGEAPSMRLEEHSEDKAQEQEGVLSARGMVSLDGPI